MGGRWVTFRCPGCGRTHREWVAFDAPRDERIALLSPVAFRILQTAPARFRRGDVLPATTLAQLTGYSPRHVRRGLAELHRAGYTARVPYGRSRTRVQYAGVPSQMLGDDVRQIVEAA